MKAPHDFAAMLQRPGALVLDGGLATQLEAQGCKLDDPLWSAKLLQSDPAQIVCAHSAYVDAGADILLSAGYQASREGFVASGATQAEADRLLLSTVSLARKAANASDREIVVAASMGPYGATLHDGSEYHGRYGVDASLLREFHERRLTVIATADADVLAFETIPSLQEARVLAELLRLAAKPSWVSFACMDGAHMCDGSRVEEAAAVFAGHPCVVALGVNCTAPQWIVSIIAALRTGAADKAIIAYPNSGEIFNAADGSWQGPARCDNFVTAAQDWIAAGAKIVGGCCRVGPEHIRALAAALAN